MDTNYNLTLELEKLRCEEEDVSKRLQETLTEYKELENRREGLAIAIEALERVQRSGRTVATPPSTTTPAPLRTRVLAFLEGKSDLVRFEDIRMAIGVDATKKQPLNNLLGKLKAQGIVENPKFGMYRLK